MELIKPTLSQLDILTPYLRGTSIRDCGFCPGNAILWAEEYHVSYTILSGMLVFISEEGGKPSSFTFPLGKGKDFVKDLQDPVYLQNAKAVFEEICAWFQSKGVTPSVHCATLEMYEIISGWYGKNFSYTLDPGDFDYIYTVEKLTGLRGKKLHGKRNHINSFLRNYPDYEYYTITDEHIDACLAVARYWVENTMSCSRILQKNMLMNIISSGKLLQTGKTSDDRRNHLRQSHPVCIYLRGTADRRYL